ncbi:mechanosensitive ion channel family protein [Clostridium sp.]|uniref:mechanosensitive ion channel family protein n=1 Tax=Clostridium sp. TaxID=1506 RepID=UPI002632A4B8|nr:mechanosensitive ion channel family protein [Clostridium sp.]
MNILQVYSTVWKIVKNDNGRYFLHIDWEGIFTKILDLLEIIINKGLVIIIITLLMYLIIKIGNKLINRFVEKQVKSKRTFSMDGKKALTVGAILKSTLKYAVYFSSAALIISKVFNVSPGILSGIGFVVGIGAQSLVRDLINGFFILFEGQFSVGDYITVGTYSGTVENIGIRSTVLKDFSGLIHVIPNGSIIEVTNHSKENIMFIVDVQIAYEEDIDNTIRIIQGVASKFEEKNKDIIKEKVEAIGAIAINHSGVTIRVVGKTKPLLQWKLERELRKEIKIALDENGIKIPYPKTQIIRD